MFKFKRGDTDYEIKYLIQGTDEYLIASYLDEGGNTKYRHILDLYELTNRHGQHYDDERGFMEFFLNDLNKFLDRAHSDGDGDSEDPKERLTSLIINNLSFDGKHVILN